MANMMANKPSAAVEQEQGRRAVQTVPLHRDRRRSLARRVDADWKRKAVFMQEGLQRDRALP